MKSTLRVPFGLKDERLYEPKPDQVDNGKACGCICPACKKPLWAKQNARTPHFAHAPGVDCARGFETAVHLAVKQIIAQKMEVRLPAVVWKNPLPRSKQVTKLYIERTIKLDSVVLEERVDDFIPDIIVSRNTEVYLVEVAVTHFVDGLKQYKIDRTGIPTIEIDVSSLKSGFTLEGLERLLFNSSDYPAEWKYHPRLEELSNEVLQVENERLAKIQEEEEREDEQFKKYRIRPHDEKLKINLKFIGLSQHQMLALTKPIQKDFNGVPNIVWQSAVLAYIGKIEQNEGWSKEQPCKIDWYDCFYWLAKVFDIGEYVSDGEKRALEIYFNHLAQLGLLKRVPNYGYQLELAKSQWDLLAGL